MKEVLLSQKEGVGRKVHLIQFLQISVFVVLGGPSGLIIGVGFPDVLELVEESSLFVDSLLEACVVDHAILVDVALHHDLFDQFRPCFEPQVLHRVVEVAGMDDSLVLSVFGFDAAKDHLPESLLRHGPSCRSTRRVMDKVRV